MENFLKIFILLAIQTWISLSAEILYVLPDNLTSAVSCPSQPCATLSQYVLDNGTLPVVSNVEYHFLPGEHHVPINMTLQNLHNFSIIGTVSKPSPLAELVLVDCSQSYIIKIIDSYDVTIANVMLKQCDHPQLTNLLISLCYSCTIENTIFMNLGLIGTNLVGRSRLTKTAVKSNRRFLMFCQKITLLYWNLRAFTDHRHDLIINQVNITGDRSKCYSDYINTVGLHISITTIAAESLTINLTNCLFSNLDHTALTIISQCYGNNKIYIKNCTFENNYIYKKMSPHEDVDFIFRPLINIISAHDNKSISFKQCKFTGNYHANILISILIRKNRLCHGGRVLCSSRITNISFVACQFIGNVASELININAKQCKGNIWIIGPTTFSKTKSGSFRHSHYITISIYYMMVDIIGPVIFSFNHANTVMFFKNCDIKFYKNITYRSNSCEEVTYIPKIQLYQNIGIQ